MNFEDNLSSHKTEAVLKFWETELKNFLPPQFVPANLTDIIQVIDRHIGIIYKRAVYRAIRIELIGRLREARVASGGADGVTIKALTPREKRIIITKAIGDCHTRLTHHLCKTYERAFIATATWTPVYHLLEATIGEALIDSPDSDLAAIVPAGPSIIPEETQVSLQHLVNYNYVERCSKDKVLSCLRKQREEKKRLRIEAEQREAALQKGRADQARDCKPFVDKALSVMEQLTTQVFTITKVRNSIRFYVCTK